MKSDELKWNERYLKEEYSNAPNKTVAKFWSLADIGCALDIAAGNGRNSKFLIEAGFEVDAIDISGVGLEKIENRNKTIQIFHEDLDFFDLKPDQYDLIININYLQRRLFPQIIGALKTNGILIFQSFIEGKQRVSNGGPIQKDHLLRKNELLHSFLSLQVIFYEEKKTTTQYGDEREAAVLVGQKQ